MACIDMLSRLPLSALKTTAKLGYPGCLPKFPKIECRIQFSLWGFAEQRDSRGTHAFAAGSFESPGAPQFFSFQDARQLEWMSLLEFVLSPPNIGFSSWKRR